MKFLGSLFIALSLSLLSLGSVFAQNTQDFYFESFDGQYYLTKNDSDISQMRVVETLVAQFPDYDQNRGILRAIPKTYNGFDLDIQITSVVDDNDKPWNYTTYTENDNLVLKIGDADIFVQDKQTYVIDYTIQNVISFHEIHDELFWDTNGDDWPQTFNIVKANIYMSGEIADGLLDEMDCFKGQYGETDRDCAVSGAGDSELTVIKVGTEDVGPYETLTFVIGIEKGIFKEDPWPARLQVINLTAISYIPIHTLIIVYRRWRKFGKDPQGKGVIPQYSPPEGLNAMAAKALVEEKFQTDSIAGAIVELAVAGYVRINELKTGKLFKKSEYELELIKDGKDLEEEQRVLIEGLFGGLSSAGSKINISKSKYKLNNLVGDLNGVIMSRLTRDGYFKEKPTKSIGRQALWGGGVIIFGIGLLIVATQFWGVGVGVLLAGVIIMIFSFFMPVKTLKGVEAKEYILGVKDYIDLAEKDRLDFHQSPEGARHYSTPSGKKQTIKLFEQLLPYAMIFGLEKKWAKQFQDLYSQPPEWFTGRAFTPAVLANSIGKLETASRGAFSPPSSSGSSGFGGGGFSGGGGGGGGGGGW